MRAVRERPYVPFWHRLTVPIPGPIQLTLPAYGVARSPVVNVRAGETVAIRPARLGELIPAIFVYDDTHALVAKNDETRGGGVFEWTSPRDTSLADRHLQQQ